MNSSYRPKKNLGQNFLTDTRIQQKIIQACDLKSEDVVVEIGPGQGVLTRLIAPQVKKLICVETDRDLIGTLRIASSQKALLHDTVEIVHADFLKWDMGQLPAKAQDHRQYPLLYFHAYYREIDRRQGKIFIGFFDSTVRVWAASDS